MNTPLKKTRGKARADKQLGQYQRTILEWVRIETVNALKNPELECLPENLWVKWSAKTFCRAQKIEASPSTLSISLRALFSRKLLEAAQTATGRVTHVRLGRPKTNVRKTKTVRVKTTVSRIFIPRYPLTLKISQVAIILGWSPQTIRNRIASGHLPALHITPRIIRIRASDLRQYVESNNP
jgi:Helix-turn-helix domain